jgi:hypothetical protein
MELDPPDVVRRVVPIAVQLPDCCSQCNFGIKLAGQLPDSLPHVAGLTVPHQIHIPWTAVGTGRVHGENKRLSDWIQTGARDAGDLSGDPTPPQPVEGVGGFQPGKGSMDVHIPERPIVKCRSMFEHGSRLETRDSGPSMFQEALGQTINIGCPCPDISIGAATANRHNLRRQRGTLDMENVDPFAICEMLNDGMRKPHPHSDRGLSGQAHMRHPKSGPPSGRTIGPLPQLNQPSLSFLNATTPENAATGHATCRPNLAENAF